MRIGSWTSDDRALIVAEIGNNHEGNPAVAEALIEAAAAAGADAVKFQTFHTPHYVTGRDERRFRQLESFELGQSVFLRLAEVARDAGVMFMSTPFDLESAIFLIPVVDAIKISSGDATFVALLDAAGVSGKPVIMSTGGLNADQVSDSVERIRSRQASSGINGGLAVLHCVSSYPVPPAQANLKAITELQSTLGVPVGYSDHVTGIEAAILAVALGARIVEKHFTLSHTYSEFRDHQLSADPDEFRVMVERIRKAESMLGTGEKVVMECEQELVPQIRRSIAAARDLEAGEIITFEDLTWVRPGTGVPPGSEDAVVGRRVTRALALGDLIDLGDLEASEA